MPYFNKNNSVVQCKTYNQKKHIKSEKEEGSERNQSYKISFNRYGHESYCSMFVSFTILTYLLTGGRQQSCGA